MSQYSMNRDFEAMEILYKKIHKFNKKQFEIMRGLCPYQPGDRVRLICSPKYAQDFKEGDMAEVITSDWTDKYNFVLQVAFDHIPKRYIWMPIRLFRNAAWVGSEGSWKLEKGKFTLTIEETEINYKCTLLDRGRQVFLFHTVGLDQAISLLESVLHSHSISNRDKLDY